MLSSRERVSLALNHEEPDRIPPLPFGTVDQVQEEVSERIRIFGPGGRFVFNTNHNVQPQTPVENVLAVYETVREYGRYSLG
jgi:uroporphyrinogen-III decarboxylase